MEETFPNNINHEWLEAESSLRLWSMDMTLTRTTTSLVIRAVLLDVAVVEMTLYCMPRGCDNQNTDAPHFFIFGVAIEL
jgi:hypothetical protein